MKKIAESSFKRLVGVWKTSGSIRSEAGERRIHGIDSYELILDGHCLLHKADVRLGDEKSETLEIIRLDSSSDTAQMHYFNGKGEGGVMTGSIIGNEFKIEGESLMFAGTINPENTYITGRWSVREEKDRWTDFIELTLEKHDH